MKTFIKHLKEYLDDADYGNIRKGKALFETYKEHYWNPQVVDTDISLDVPSENSPRLYNVTVSLDGDIIDVTCECPAYKKYFECKHCMAAVFWCLDNEDELPTLSEDITENVAQKKKVKQYPSKPPAENGFYYITVVIHGPLQYWTISHLGSGKGYGLNQIKLAGQSGPTLFFEFKKTKKEEYHIVIEYDGKHSYRTGCTCGLNTKQGKVCVHIYAAFQYVMDYMSSNYFQQFRDFSEEKAAILKKYNLTPDDPEAKLFDWGIDYSGNLQLRTKPDFIVTRGDNDFFEHLKKGFRGSQGNSSVRVRPATSVITDYEAGILFNFVSVRHCGLEIEAVEVREKNGQVSYKKISSSQEMNWPKLRPLNDELYDLVTGLSDKGLLEWMGYQGRTYFRGSQNPWQHIIEGDIRLMRKRFYELLRMHWDQLVNWKPVLILLEGKFSNANVKPVQVSAQFISISFSVQLDERFVSVNLMPKVEGEEWTDKQISVLRGFIFMVDNTLYIPERVEDISTIETFHAGFLKFAREDVREVFKSVIAPLMEHYPVTLPEQLKFQTIDTEPQPQLHLAELNEQSLMLFPKYLYENSLVEAGEGSVDFIDDESGFKTISRKLETEKKFFEFVRQLHPKFAQQRNNPYFYLPFPEVMRNNWFLKTIQTMQDAGYAVYGLQNLKRFRYNTSAPKWEMNAGSGTDWFDIAINISWGDLKVPLKDVRKALANQQTTVLLDDGTLGLLPEEWIKQYSLLMKMGEENKGSIRISKRHLGILDELAAQLNNTDVMAEIKSKKEKLALLGDFKTSSLSKEISATLRPYQQSGFQWLQTLDDLGWGGCLADDMGLGKTLQTISFLQYLKEKYRGSTHLVICPTSLLYNWQKEIEKFCPSLQYHVYYGASRELGDEHFESYDVVLTSYGLARNDIEQLTKFNWHYVILDESQAIKNPDAVTTKAVSVLPAKNRLVLSGTPVQNNTYDLYAQFNFINPGLLGSRDFFKTEFANAIDKQADKNKAGQLRKMIYPFLLRRTKEQVTPDLPDKTETVLWCEMDREQRSIYESYRKYYREAIIKKIEEVGMNKAGMYVLEGLLRLRQICDHPSLLKDENSKSEESVKTEELLREVEENTGQHKILIFSQFVEMLQLIRKELKSRKLSFAYLDGSTTLKDRQKAVEDFQSNEETKIFLISLKAGGVGLNLTAADYVYIVDPWWNPAAEQQAIDRTHRIGQTRKIFAYKMICKDTVEEKILKLQEKKKNLADELVSEDAGFVKKLTKEDIEFLLS